MTEKWRSAWFYVRSGDQVPVFVQGFRLVPFCGGHLGGLHAALRADVWFYAGRVSHSWVLGRSDGMHGAVCG